LPTAHSPPRREGVEGMTALAAAASRGRTACLRVLLVRGADLSLPNKEGRTPVFLAAAGGFLASLRVLLGAFEPGEERRVGAWHPDCGGRTPAMAAAAGGHLDCLKLVIQS
ncbi:unnamed protein product, partial [Discosporangium mesarthrocarpum]